MKKIIEHLKQKNLWPEALADFVPHLLVIDNDCGNNYIHITDYKTDIRLIMNALNIDFESKPYLSSLLETYANLEWGMTINKPGPIYSMYIGFDDLPDVETRTRATLSDPYSIDPLLDSLKKQFPVPSIQLARTSREFENREDFNSSFFAIGFYYNIDTDEIVEYKQYYSAAQRNVMHVYRMNSDKTFKSFDEEVRHNNYNAFKDTIGVKKVIGPHLNVESSVRSSEDKTYVGITTEDYANRSANIIL